MKVFWTKKLTHSHITLYLILLIRMKIVKFELTTILI